MHSSKPARRRRVVVEITSYPCANTKSAKAQSATSSSRNGWSPWRRTMPAQTLSLSAIPSGELQGPHFPNGHFGIFREPLPELASTKQVAVGDVVGLVGRLRLGGYPAHC